MRKNTKKNDEIVTCTEGHPIMVWRCVHGRIAKMRCCDKHLEIYRGTDHGMFVPCKECDHDKVPHHDEGGRRENVVQTQPRFVPSIGRAYEHRVVQRVINGPTAESVRLAKKMRIWSVKDLLKRDYLDHADPNGGYYTYEGCLRRCGGMNDADGGTYVRNDRGDVEEAQ